MKLTTKTDINTIIFDLGAVLIDWNPAYLYRKIFDDQDKMEHFLRAVCTPEWNAQQDAGRTWAEATDLLIKRHPDYEEEIRAYWHRWPEMLNGPIRGTVEILEEFVQQQQFRLLALTNWSAETWPYAWEQYKFLRHFEGILVSGKEQMKKPDPRIYRLISDRYQVDPPRALFIDDSADNIRSAREFGFQTIQFFSPEQLRRELKQLNLMPV